MSCKLSILVLCVTIIAHITAVEIKEPDYGPVEYEFHYEVNDPHTGDIKSHKESRKGDKVEGVYQLIEPDGHRRIVKYTADDHSGFEAIVNREPTDIKIPQPESQDKVVHPKREAPLVHYSYAPAPQAHLEEPKYENHVSFSGRGTQYQY